jgi:hypothetical protein
LSTPADADETVELTDGRTGLSKVVATRGRLRDRVARKTREQCGTGRATRRQEEHETEQDPDGRAHEQDECAGEADSDFALKLRHGPAVRGVGFHPLFKHAEWLNTTIGV